MCPTESFHPTVVNNSSNKLHRACEAFLFVFDEKEEGKKENNSPISKIFRMSQQINIDTSPHIIINAMPLLALLSRRCACRFIYLNIYIYIYICKYKEITTRNHNGAEARQHKKT
ncbi:hypothetical protein, unlikely [Trypanosoma brucei gambiense DAL972]|uniref:Uncharacterized protein n=1 Tax=Trypanosoma brucei gambiense (strain MHOM/CI/86/DAL972) TaxID=679716 RepID=C9ZN89_TRYB9|nr:hypothetical protein, unlikely [Trypanosoma brucei gambiense DAL972]CBH10867.1 hypothetical protein, unlikely [Trypanosoma brucei gambiense DAL972]|eukprot:XP_011773154.1 hypothetical protein, unlikely [Trypanosoma brucei gambiense DAL972]